MKNVLIILAGIFFYSMVFITYKYFYENKVNVDVFELAGDGVLHFKDYTGETISFPKTGGSVGQYLREDGIWVDGLIDSSGDYIIYSTFEALDGNHYEYKDTLGSVTLASYVKTDQAHFIQIGDDVRMIYNGKELKDESVLLRGDRVGWIRNGMIINLYDYEEHWTPQQFLNLK